MRRDEDPEEQLLDHQSPQWIPDLPPKKPTKFSNPDDINILELDSYAVAEWLKAKGFNEDLCDEFKGMNTQCHVLYICSYIIYHRIICTGTPVQLLIQSIV